MSRPKILFLAHLLPWPLTGGGQIKSYHTLRALSERYDVTLAAVVRGGDTAADVAGLNLKNVRLMPLSRGVLSDPADAVRALARRTSFLVSRDDRPAIRSVVSELLSEGRYDAIHVDHLQMAQFVPDSLPHPAKIVLDQHNVEHRLIRRIAETPGAAANPLLRWYAGVEWPKLRRFEATTLRRADVTLAVSDADRDEFVSLAPELSDRIETVPIGVDTDYFAVAERDPGSDAILSVGTMSWLPNVDAVLWFVSEILPLVRERRPGVRVSVVGANPAKAIVALGKRDPAVVVTGTVPDVRPYAKGCGVFVVPLRSGSGMRVKILNALSMGLPVVSTSVGAEGIAVTHGENILIADDASEFADAVCRVLGDPAFADRLGAGGRALAEEEYTWGVVGARLHAVYERVLRVS